MAHKDRASKSSIRGKSHSPSSNIPRKKKHINPFEYRHPFPHPNYHQSHNPKSEAVTTQGLSTIYIQESNIMKGTQSFNGATLNRPNLHTPQPPNQTNIQSQNLLINPLPHVNPDYLASNYNTSNHNNISYSKRNKPHHHHHTHNHHSNHHHSSRNHRKERELNNQHLTHVTNAEEAQEDSKPSLSQNSSPVLATSKKKETDLKPSEPSLDASTLFESCTEPKGNKYEQHSDSRHEQNSSDDRKTKKKQHKDSKRALSRSPSSSKYSDTSKKNEHDQKKKKKKHTNSSERVERSRHAPHDTNENVDEEKEEKEELSGKNWWEMIKPNRARGRGKGAREEDSYTHRGRIGTRGRIMNNLSHPSMIRTTLPPPLAPPNQPNPSLSHNPPSKSITVDSKQILSDNLPESGSTGDIDHSKDENPDGRSFPPFGWIPPRGHTHFPPRSMMKFPPNHPLYSVRTPFYTQTDQANILDGSTQEPNKPTSDKPNNYGEYSSSLPPPPPPQHLHRTPHPSGLSPIQSAQTLIPDPYHSHDSSTSTQDNTQNLSQPNQSKRPLILRPHAKWLSNENSSPTQPILSQSLPSNSLSSSSLKPASQSDVYPPGASPQQSIPPGTSTFENNSSSIHTKFPYASSSTSTSSLDPSSLSIHHTSSTYRLSPSIPILSPSGQPRPPQIPSSSTLPPHSHIPETFERQQSGVDNSQEAVQNHPTKSDLLHYSQALPQHTPPPPQHTLHPPKHSSNSQPPLQGKHFQHSSLSTQQNAPGLPQQSSNPQQQHTPVPPHQASLLQKHPPTVHQSHQQLKPQHPPSLRPTLSHASTSLSSYPSNYGTHASGMANFGNQLGLESFPQTSGKQGAIEKLSSTLSQRPSTTRSGSILEPPQSSTPLSTNSTEEASSFDNKPDRSNQDEETQPPQSHTPRFPFQPMHPHPSYINTANQSQHGSFNPSTSFYPPHFPFNQPPNMHIQPMGPPHTLYNQTPLNCEEETPHLHYKPPGGVSYRPYRSHARPSSSFSPPSRPSTPRTSNLQKAQQDLQAETNELQEAISDEQHKDGYDEDEEERKHTSTNQKGKEKRDKGNPHNTAYQRRSVSNSSSRSSYPKSQSQNYSVPDPQLGANPEKVSTRSIHSRHSGLAISARSDALDGTSEPSEVGDSVIDSSPTHEENNANGPRGGPTSNIDTLYTDANTAMRINKPILTQRDPHMFQSTYIHHSNQQGPNHDLISHNAPYPPFIGQQAQIHSFNLSGDMNMSIVTNQQHPAHMPPSFHPENIPARGPHPRGIMFHQHLHGPPQLLPHPQHMQPSHVPPQHPHLHPQHSQFPIHSSQLSHKLSHPSHFHPATGHLYSKLDLPHIQPTQLPYKSANLQHFNPNLDYINQIHVSLDQDIQFQTTKSMLKSIYDLIPPKLAGKTMNYISEIAEFENQAALIVESKSYDPSTDELSKSLNIVQNGDSPLLDNTLNGPSSHFEKPASLNSSSSSILKASSDNLISPNQIPAIVDSTKNVEMISMSDDKMKLEMNKLGDYNEMKAMSNEDMYDIVEGIEMYFTRDNFHTAVSNFSHNYNNSNNFLLPINYDNDTIGIFNSINSITYPPPRFITLPATTLDSPLSFYTHPYTSFPAPLSKLPKLASTNNPYNFQKQNPITETIMTQDTKLNEQTPNSYDIEVSDIYQRKRIHRSIVVVPSIDPPILYTSSQMQQNCKTAISYPSVLFLAS